MSILASLNKILKSKKLLFWCTCIALLPFLNSCSSCAIKEKCEKTDWYQHGKDLAMHGSRATGDALVEECRKVDVIQESQLDVGFKEGRERYCTLEAGFAVGRKGQKFNFDLCDPDFHRRIGEKHYEGIVAYCQPESGEEEGRAGRLYTQICPQYLEKKFMPRFKLGRSNFLDERIKQNQTKVADLNREISQSTNEQRQIQYELDRVPRAYEVSRQEYNPTSKVYETKKEIVDPYQSQRSSLSNSLNTVSAEVQKQKTDLVNAQTQLREDSTELGILRVSVQAPHP